jgi:hypothetical protein
MINHLKAKTVTKTWVLYHAVSVAPCIVSIKEYLYSDLFFNYAVPITQVTSLRKRSSTMPLSTAVEQNNNK